MTVARARPQLAGDGVAGALTPKRSPNSARPRSFDGASEAKLVAPAGSAPPEGRARWTLQVLEDKAVEPRIPTRKAAAWQNARNSKHTAADWHFTTADARVKPKRPCPAL